MTIDNAYAKLSTIREEIEAGIAHSHSEQDSRFRIINRLLTEVLGWQHNLIKTEPPTENGYIDYLIQDSDGRSLCVIEAKKIGALNIDTASTALTTVNVGGKVLKSASEAIDQATRYSGSVGATYAALTDGERWVFFRSIRSDGMPPTTGKAFIFPTFASILEDFATFYELLAPEALREQLHFARLNNLEGGHIRATEERHFIDDPDRARFLHRTELSRDIVELFKKFFAAMAAKDDNEMRRACFVETAESQEAEAALKKIATHLTSAISTLDLSQSKELQAEIERFIESSISEICLIVGGSGSGKTTFIERFFEDVLPSPIKDKCVIVTVNVSGYPGSEVGLQQWLSERLRDEYEKVLFSGAGPTYEDYMGMFFSTYRRWSTATYSRLYQTKHDEFRILFGKHVEDRRETRPHEYAVGLPNHTIFGRNRLPCVIFDDVDRLPPSDQQEVIRYASIIKNESTCFILISSGDKAVWRLSKETDIRSYFSRSFYLPAPPVKDILSKRVGYIRAKLEGDERISKEYFSSKGLKISIGNLGAFATVIEDTLVNHSSISTLLGRLSNFDITEMLHLSEQIISSPSLKVDDLVKSYFTPRNALPFEEKRVVEAMILGEYDRYSNSANRFVFNVFATDGSFPYSPLLACSILQVLLAAKASNPSDIDSPLMTVSGLLNFFEPCGVARDETRRAIKHMFDSRLVSALDPSLLSISDSSLISISPRGEAHLELAMRSETYLAEMARVTGFRSIDTKSRIEAEVRKTHPVLANDLFSRALLAEDAAKFRVPNAEGYSILTKMRNEFDAYWSVRPTSGMRSLV